jgi:hypothetical protein
MRGLSVLMVAAALLATSAGVRADQAPAAATIADVRCVVVASIFASEPANASSAALLTFYFLGRIDGRESPSFNLSQAMFAQLQLMSKDDLTAEGKRCGKELEGRAVYMTDVGKALMEEKK